MPLYLQTILQQFNTGGPSDIVLNKAVLLRHQDNRSAKGRTPYHLWRFDRPSFERYQSTQNRSNRAKLKRPQHWISFVGTPDGATLLAGVYWSRYLGLLDADLPWPHGDGIDLAGSCDHYELGRDERFADLEGRLVVHWSDTPSGYRAWVQMAEDPKIPLSRNPDRLKPVVEIKVRDEEPPFPGYLQLVKPVSHLVGLPSSWIAALKLAKGIYLLSHLKNKKHYVGKADGKDGFWQRWMDYATTGHGGNVGLESCKPDDLEVTILEVAGSGHTAADIQNMEDLWKRKLHSKELGLNRN